MRTYRHALLVSILALLLPATTPFLSLPTSFVAQRSSIVSPQTSTANTSEDAAPTSASSELLKFVAASDRSDETCSTILNRIKDLEASYDTSSFAASSLEGSWLLEFVINPDKGTQGDVSAQGIVFPTEGQKTTQDIDADKQRIVNTITTSEGLFTKVEVSGDLELKSPKRNNRAWVTFTGGEVNNSVNLDPLFSFINWLKDLGLSTGEAWVDTTYIDSICRVARGNKGSIFLLSKVGAGEVDEAAKSLIVEKKAKEKQREEDIKAAVVEAERLRESEATKEKDQVTESPPPVAEEESITKESAPSPLQASKRGGRILKRAAKLIAAAGVLAAVAKVVVRYSVF